MAGRATQPGLSFSDCSHLDAGPQFVMGAVSAALVLVVLWQLVLRGGGRDGSSPFRHRQGAPRVERPTHASFYFQCIPEGRVRARAALFADTMEQRRSVRFFDPSRAVPIEAVRDIVRAAASAPSGAHQQPWTFVVVRSAAAKRAIREAVEAEERVNYARRMGAEWVDKVRDLVADLHSADEVTKPYLTDAPALVVLMKQQSGPGGEKHHYPTESVGIAAGMLVAAIHQAGLATLTSTPLGAGARIGEILGRPPREKVFLLMPVGYAAPSCSVPFRAPGKERKPLEEVMPVV